MVYHIKGKDAYLAVVEAFGPTGNRYFRSFVSPTLDGVWTPLAADWSEPVRGQDERHVRRRTPGRTTSATAS